MNRKSLIAAGILTLAIPVVGLAAPKQMILEIDPQKLLGDEGPSLQKCDNLHQESGSCICCNYHVEGVSQTEIADAVAAGKARSLVGTTLKLRSATSLVVARIDRITPLYRLDSGATFTPAGDWNPRDASGERWTSEHAGIYKSRTVAAWNDLNHDGLVGPGDELVFDNGEPSKVVTVGIGLHVTTMSETKVPGGRPQK